jgi:hypothetical protein
MVGYIYLIRDLRTGLVKIGFSKDPYRRLKQLTHESTLLPEPLEFRLVDAWRATLKEEQRLHQVFQSCRVRGEWFDLCSWKSFGISDAFDCRPRVKGMEWERCHDGEQPFEALENVIGCKCDECSTPQQIH